MSSSSENVKEWEIPETTYVRDIETKVFQGIILHCLIDIKGISLLGSNFIQHILGREDKEQLRGIYVEQDNKKSALKVKVEINVHYGISIPEKATEIQEKVLNDLMTMTGLHVSSIHIIFKNLLSSENEEESKYVFEGEKTSSEEEKEFS